MKTPAFGLPALVLAILLLSPASCRAQYAYLDSNGDGVYTAADVLHGTGPPCAIYGSTSGITAMGLRPSAEARRRRLSTCSRTK